MAKKQKPVLEGGFSAPSFWLGGSLFERIFSGIKVKILGGNVFHYYQTVLKILDEVETDYNQLTISPALFEAISDDTYESYYRKLIEAAKNATIHLAHIKEDFLKNVIFKEWENSSQQNNITPPIKSTELEQDYNKVNQFLMELEQGLARTQLNPINNDPKQPLPILISVANTQTQNSAKGLIVSFEFSRCIRQSFYRGFYTDKHHIAIQIKNIFDSYIKSMT